MTTTFSVPAMRLPVDATLTVPGSKSHANRAIVCAALASGTTEIRGATPCDDVCVMVENLKKMGCDIQWVNQHLGFLRIHGGFKKNPREAAGLAGPAAGALHEGRDGSRKGTDKVPFRPQLDCNNAGTTLRFLTSVAALRPGTWTVTGNAHMQKRPVADLTAALRSLGADVSDTDGCPPLRIEGGTLRGGTVRVKANISSQYISSLLMIAPLLPGGLTLETEGEVASRGYIDITMKTMRDFGVSVKKEMNKFIVQEGQYSARSSYEIDGDWSAAGPWLVLQALGAGNIRMSNLAKHSEQRDSTLPSVIARMKNGGDITVDVTDIPDQLMNLAVFACTRRGTTVFTGAKNLRFKECDRLHVLRTELAKAGVSITEQEDGVTVDGMKTRRVLISTSSRVTLDPNDDHRMAMCFAILGLLRGGIVIKNPGCVDKSYPAFFDDLSSVLRSSTPITVVGMRGVGKSSLGRRLASKLKLTHLDSDHLFQDRHGPIKAYVALHGWDAFRREEESVIQSALRPGTVLSLGGGALGAKSTRMLVKKHSVPVWLQAKETELIKRLKSGKRPPLTDLPLHEEVRKFLVERGPHYREVAAVEVGPALAFQRQVPFCLKKLRERFLSSLA